MKFTQFLVTIINSVAAAKGLKSPLDGYTAVPMVFRGVNMTDSTEVVLSGTIQVGLLLDVDINFVCTRISCSWDAAIWFCNDTPVEKKHSCADLASFAVDIRSECHSLIGKDYVIQGQKFDVDDFNVIVGADDC
ncbi:hypothetical protein SLS62_010122 [Diatrype stigma]|uniref:Uncharacterized protein n=1 Tax=Diatrype stigma TaxID=117547 RepID=A0AAN9UBS3_9PEZI